MHSTLLKICCVVLSEEKKKSVLFLSLSLYTFTWDYLFLISSLAIRVKIMKIFVSEFSLFCSLNPLLILRSPRLVFKAYEGHMYFSAHCDKCSWAPSFWSSGLIGIMEIKSQTITRVINGSMSHSVRLGVKACDSNSAYKPL